MLSKRHTVLLVPHGRARFHKLQLSNLHLLLAGVTALVLLVVPVVLAWAHFTTPVDARELALLRSEADNLRQVNGTFERSIRKLEQQLEEYEERTRKLALVAGVEELGTAGESGLGGEMVSGGAEDGVDLSGLGDRAARLGAQLSAVEEKIDRQLRWISAVPAITPARGLLASGFGYRADPITGQRAFHQGIDISATAGKPVHAAADGIVVRTGRLGNLGSAVFVSHGFGYTTRYGHLGKIVVRPGEHVRRGTVLGYVGSTGRATGYHLHYEVRQNGEPVDPLPFMLDRTSSS